ncbi:hypothetical protein [Salinibacterium sp. M195]|uniref:hypothetical protein n=1 Tax=Salinibacterium sp. M195 TaxID=2583374 RepID=UPI0021064979|nr:hypothetical protein [Salinibacterium sp. M195]QYH35311.1 hypothetical protein FFT87_04730 [Salinibacterium sp. M195]
MRKIVTKASAIALALTFSLLAGAAPASAAAGVGVVEVSDDGVAFARSFPGAIFDDIGNLSPGDNQSDTIYVRNVGSASGYLRVTLRDVSYSDQAFADALTVSTTISGGSGNAVALSSANPCAVTSEGVLIAPGQTVSMLASLMLGDLSGTAGQGATASASLRITLSDTTPGTLPATACSGTGTTVPVTPTTPGVPTATDSHTTGSGTAGSATGIAAVPTATPSPSPSFAATPDEASESGLLPAFPSTFSLDPNTWRLYQEYLVLILVLAAMIGAGISWLAGRRRTRRDAEDA